MLCRCEWLLQRKIIYGIITPMLTNASLKKTAIIAASLLLFSGAAAHGATTRTLNENSANKTYAIKVGSVFHLLLHSTYWTLTAIPSSAPIKSLGEPVGTAPTPAATGPAGPANPPGMGTGTIDWSLKALKIGKFDLKASRTSCGEALRCTDAQSSYVVHIKVTK